VNDSFRTPICLWAPPREIAVSALKMAFKMRVKKGKAVKCPVSIQEKWKKIDSQFRIDKTKIERIQHKIMGVYEMPKKFKKRSSKSAGGGTKRTSSSASSSGTRPAGGSSSRRPRPQDKSAGPRPRLADKYKPRPTGPAREKSGEQKPNGQGVGERVPNGKSAAATGNLTDRKPLGEQRIHNTGDVKPLAASSATKAIEPKKGVTAADPMTEGADGEVHLMLEASGSDRATMQPASKNSARTDNKIGNGGRDELTRGWRCCGSLSGAVCMRARVHACARRELHSRHALLFPLPIRR